MDHVHTSCSLAGDGIQSVALLHKITHISNVDADFEVTCVKERVYDKTPHPPVKTALYLDTLLIIRIIIITELYS